LLMTLGLAQKGNTGSKAQLKEARYEGQWRNLRGNKDGRCPVEKPTGEGVAAQYRSRSRNLNLASEKTQIAHASDDTGTNPRRKATLRRTPKPGKALGGETSRQKPSCAGERTGRGSQGNAIRSVSASDPRATGREGSNVAGVEGGD